MARAEPEVLNRFRVEQDRLDHFDHILVDSHKQEWWRLYIYEVKSRMNDFLFMLADGLLDQRAEDRLRGQILECNFVLTLHERAKGLTEEQERKDRQNG